MTVRPADSFEGLTYLAVLVGEAASQEVHLILRPLGERCPECVWREVTIINKSYSSVTDSWLEPGNGGEFVRIYLRGWWLLRRTQ